MEQKSKGPPNPKIPRHKVLRLRNGQETTKGTPDKIKRIQAQAPLTSVLTEARSETNTALAPPDGAKSNDGKPTLKFRILFTKGKQFWQGSRTISHPTQLFKSIVGVNRPV